MELTLAQLALKYASAGYAVIPITPGSKRPPLVSWQGFTKPHHAPSIEQVMEWWDRWPVANIGIITGQVSQLNVVDVDPQNGAPDVQHETVVVSTPSGGRHYYFASDDIVGCSVSARIKGIDIRGDGGYVVAPGSITGKGGWKVEPPSELQHIINRRFALWSSVSDVYAPRRTMPPNTECEVTEVTSTWLNTALTQPCPKGKRNDTLARLAGYYVKKRIPKDVALSQLMLWNKSQCHPPLPFDELTTTVQSVFRHEKGEVDHPRVFELRELDEFMYKYEGYRASWTVEDWLPESTIGFLVGPPGVGKTWLEYDLALSVATGAPFLGRFPVHKSGPVLLFQQEDPPPLIAERLGILLAQKTMPPGFRADQLKEGDHWPLPPAGLPLFILDGRHFEFRSQAAAAALVATVQRHRPALVIFDPLYTMADPKDWFSDVARQISVLKELRNTYGTSFLLAHHTKKMGKEDTGREQLWGSQLLNATMETVWQMRPIEGAGSFNFSVNRSFKTAAARKTARFAMTVDEESFGRGFIVQEIIDEVETTTEEGEKGPAPLDDLDHSILYCIQAGTVNVGDIAKRIGKSRPTISRRLASLVASGRVVQDGRAYRISKVDL